MDSQQIKTYHLTFDRRFLYLYNFQYLRSDQVPAHGMYLVTDTGVVMFDTPGTQPNSSPA